MLRQERQPGYLRGERSKMRLENGNMVKSFQAGSSAYGCCHGPFCAKKVSNCI